MTGIPVTRTFLPPLGELERRLEGIWASGWVTSNGACARELEHELGAYLGLRHLHLVASGTDGLQIALHALGVRGEVLTTALSFVATASAVAWVGCEPVLVDVDRETWNLDPTCLDGLIGPQTGAVLATHLFGNPADTVRIEAVAARYGVPVIYDAAHAFGVTLAGQSLLEAGDLSVLSFHATKVFHTVEGGGLACRDPALAARVATMRTFGLRGGDQGYERLGINSKLSELHAAVGLCVLPAVPDLIARRGALSAIYDGHFQGVPGLERQRFPAGVTRNHAYYPLLFDAEATVLRVQEALGRIGVFPRRYFYPALTAADYTRGMAPVAEDLACRLLCLPLSHDLTEAAVARIADTVLETLGSC